MDAACDIAEKVEQIHPARFFFNAGSTPKAWNEKMLNDVDLTFGKAFQYIDKLEIVAAWLRKRGIGGVSSVIIGKAGH